MKAIKNIYIIIIMLILIIVRPFAPGFWVGSIVILGLFIIWIDSMHRILLENNKSWPQKQRARFAMTVLVMAVVGIIILAFAILNLVFVMEWLNSATVLDEITLLTVLISLEQEYLIKQVMKFIKGAKNND